MNDDNQATWGCALVVALGVSMVMSLAITIAMLLR